MAQTKEERLRDVHARAMTRFDTIHGTVQDERRQCVEDRRFYSIAGAMWEDWLGEQFENSPRFEINKVAKAVIRIISEYRSNRITVDFRPKDEDADSDTADTLDGLYRADEQEFTAQEAYDNAFEEGVGGGIGSWRLRAVLEDEYDDDDEDDERQRIAIEPIFDADSSVFWDLDAKRYDKADARFCYVITAMTVEAFKDEYPDMPASSFEGGGSITTMFDWFTPDVVYVAEYYEVEEKKQTIHVYGSTLPGQEERRLTDADLQDPDQMAVLKVLQFRELRQEKKRSRAVHKYILNGAVTLEDCGRIAGKCIPIVPFFGKRWYVDNIERCQGEVRLSKDAQRLLNMQVSRLGEVSATTPFEVPMLTPEQVAGHEISWKNGNILRHPYRLVNAILNKVTGEKSMPPVQNVKPPDVPPTLAALFQLTNAAIDDLTGGGGQAQPLVSNISNDAVETVQQQNDQQHFIYMDNMAKSMRRSGQIWLSMAKELMAQEGRQMQTVDMEGESKNVSLMQPSLDGDGNPTTINDPTKGDYGVYVDVGPSFVSRRQSTVRAIRGLMQNTQDPELLSVLGYTALMNMDGEGMGDLRAFARKKAIAMGAVKPTKEEQAELAQAQAQADQRPDPNAEFLAAEAKKSLALAGKAEADTGLSKANTVKALADAARLGADTHATTIDTHIAAGNALADAAQPRAPV